MADETNHDRGPSSGSVAKLISRVRPPAVPTPADTERGLDELRVSLPQGYLEIARAYGPGTFAEEIEFYVPGSSHLAFDLLDWTREWTDTNRLRLEDRSSARRWKHALWPEPGGLVAWGHFAEAACLWWDTSDPDPNVWPTVIEDWETLSTRTFDVPAEQVVLDLIDGAIDWPYRLPIDPKSADLFEPALLNERPVGWEPPRRTLNPLSWLRRS